MSEINGVSSIDNKNTYNSTSVKKTDSSDFSSFLGETKSMDAIFDEAADKYNVPVELLKAVGKTESNFTSDAVSRCGAQGVMQLMPATAKELGVANSFDARQNIMGGAKYISGLLKKYEGNTTLAIAAYNAGSGNVAKYNGIPPFKETQHYVKKVMGFYSQGDIEIADTSNKATNNSVASRAVTAPVAAPVQRNLAFLLSNDSDSATGDVDNLNSLFSYDDYMKFVELFLKDDKDEETENKEEQTSSYNTNEINYNVPVMNLLKNQNLI